MEEAVQFDSDDNGITTRANLGSIKGEWISEVIGVLAEISVSGVDVVDIGVRRTGGRLATGENPASAVCPRTMAEFS